MGRKVYKARTDYFEIPEQGASAGYIYLMYTDKAKSNLCYVGQSTANGISRLKDHFTNTYTESGSSKDPSTQIIRQWPLKFINFDCYFSKGGRYYGFSREVYVEFFSKFRKKGGARIDPKDSATAIKQSGSLIKIKLEYLKNDDGSDYYVTVGDLLNVAEILWACKMRLLGYQMTNNDMGGQQIVWEYQDLNGQWIPITANVTTIDQFIKIILSTNLSEIDKQMLLSVKNKIDPLLEKMLDENLADILTYAIIDTIKNCKNLMSKESSIYLRDVVKNVIVEMFSGGRKKRLKELSGKTMQAFEKFKQDLNAVLTPDEKMYVGLIDIEEQIAIEQPIIEDFMNSLISDIAGKLTTSFLQLKKNLTKVSELDWKFYIKDHLISVKGKNGVNKESDIRKSFTASIEQYLRLPTVQNLSNTGTLLSGDFPIPDAIITDEEKWNWTVERFDIIMRRVIDSNKSLIGLASAPDAASHFFLYDDEHALLSSTKVKTSTDTLSYQVRKEYFKWLSPLNRILVEWRDFFSTLYALGDARWDTEETSDGQIAILKESYKVEGVSEDPVKIGFFLKEPGTFFTHTDKNMSVKTVTF